MECTRQHTCGIGGPCNGFPRLFAIASDEAGHPMLVEPVTPPKTLQARVRELVDEFLDSLLEISPERRASLEIGESFVYPFEINFTMTVRMPSR